MLIRLKTTNAGEGARATKSTVIHTYMSTLTSMNMCMDAG